MFPLMGPVQGGEDFMGFVHPGSAMFNRQSAGNYLSKTWAQAETSRRIGSFSCWARLGEINTLSIQRTLISGGSSSNNSTKIRINSNYKLEFLHEDGGVFTDQLITTQVFKDPTAWYHILVTWDTTQATASDRLSFYVNGEKVTAFDTTNYPALNKDFDLAYNGQPTRIGLEVASDPWEGFLCDIHYIDGTEYGPLNFGRFNAIHGEFIPREVMGLTYGNNGVHLDFADPSDLGNDVSGNGNNFTAQGTFGAANGFLDVPANTFPIGNSVMASTGADWSEACLTVTEASASASGSHATHVLPPGKWRWTCRPGSTSGIIGFEVAGEYESSRAGTNILGFGSRRGVAYNGNGVVLVDGVSQGTFGNWVANDLVTFWVDNTDPTSIKVWIDLNGTQQGSGSPDPATGTDPIVTYTSSHPFPVKNYIVPAWGHDTSQLQKMDFGQRRGSDSFIATALGDFKQISTGNFPVRSGPALQPDKYFKILKWTGDGANNRTIDGLKFRPKMICLKRLDAAGAPLWVFDIPGFDPQPGTPRNMSSASTNGQGGNTAGVIEQINDDGFDIANGGASVSDVNALNGEYVAYCWADGPEAGLWVDKIDGTGANRTQAHGLGQKPGLYFVKRLDAAGSWQVYHSTYGLVADPETDFGSLESSAAFADNNTIWNDTIPSDINFGLGTAASVNASGGEYVAVAFGESIPGFMQVRSYEGNSNANGAFIPADFAPQVHFALKNRNTAAVNWLTQDREVEVSDPNPLNDVWLPNSTGARLIGTSQVVDFVAAGSKRRGSGIGDNSASDWFILIAYAEADYKYARAR